MGPSTSTQSIQTLPKATDSFDAVMAYRGLVLRAVAQSADEALVIRRMFLPGECIERSSEALDWRQRVEVRIRSASRRIGFQQLMQQFGKLLVHDGKRLKSRQIVYVANQRAVVASTLIQYAPSKQR